MTEAKDTTGPRQLWVWGLGVAVAVTLFSLYAASASGAAPDAFLLPLDDVYIHFQYARQLASGQPYVYNPGQPPTSGATSFLYPYVLAVGYFLGFQGLNLGQWAMLVGAVALAVSLVLVYRLVRLYGPVWLALVLMLAFGLSGPVAWHYFSGMETGLVTLLLLWMLLNVAERRYQAFAISAVLLALFRPEMGLLAALAAVVMFWRYGRGLRGWWLLLPVLALGVQPLVNLLVTGSAQASGSSAKSVFGVVPFDWGIVIGRVWDNFSRMWVELLTGYSPREGWYLPPGFGLVALAGIILMVARPPSPALHPSTGEAGSAVTSVDLKPDALLWRVVSLLILGWLLAGTAAIATLDTAFWHFKRYQLPLMALFFPLVGWAVAGLLPLRNPMFAIPRYASYVFVGVITPIFVVMGLLAFRSHFALNVAYVYAQPYQMALWLQANTPEDAVIAVHDVGMMRYMGGRTTLDMVGLTTPGAAAYWRSGPGSVAEFLIMYQPDYIASYGAGHGFGLGMIADTRIYGAPLASFPVELDPRFNVALAADVQGIYQPDWADIIETNPFLRNMPLVDDAQTLNVANLASEAAFGYDWTTAPDLPGFPTVVHDLPGGNCQTWPLEVDGQRLIGQAESFTVQTVPGQGMLLMTMFNPVPPGTYAVYAGETLIDRNWIPNTEGCWSIARTYIPGDVVNGDTLTVRIEPEGNYYLPAHHAVIPYTPPEVDTQAALATYQEGAFGLTQLDVLQNPGSLLLDMLWFAGPEAAGNYRFFAHVYDRRDQPPVAQTDTYLLHAPPGNWPVGVQSATLVVDLGGVPTGTYHLAIGFYDPVTNERLMPVSDTYEATVEGRLFLGEVEVNADE